MRFAIWTRRAEAARGHAAAYRALGAIRRIPVRALRNSPGRESTQSGLSDDRVDMYPGGSLSGAEHRMRRRRILVVDDYVPGAYATAQLLRLSGHAVMTAYAANDVVPIAVAFRPEVILLDIALAGEHDGLTVARWLRGQRSLANVVLVALTGFDQREEVARIQEAGFDHYLLKPVSLEALESVVSAVPVRPEGAGLDIEPRRFSGGAGAARRAHERDDT